MLHENKFFRFIVLGVAVLSLTAIGCAAKKAMWGSPQTGLILNYDIPRDTTLNYKNSAKAAQ